TKRVKKDCSQPYVREAEISRQINQAIHSVLVPEDWLVWMTGELHSEQAQHAAHQHDFLTLLRGKIAQSDEKLQRLTAAYLDQAMSIAEYKEHRNKLIEEKTTLKQELAQVEKNAAGWFEPAGCFLKSLSEATLIAAGDDQAKKRDFLRK